MSNRLRALLVAGMFASGFGNATAAERVGEAVLIKTTVTGDGRTLATRSPVHRDERLRTSSTGLGEFIFQDGTKFALGMNSSVVIDKFIYANNKSFKDLTINAAKGSFRWISGGSPSAAYKINTPSGTIGIRGTALDVYVGNGGVTAVVLLKGAARFCGRNGCKDLQRRCDYVLATPRGGITNPTRVQRSVLRELTNARALPFLTGDQNLSRRFQTGDSCGLSSSISTIPSDAFQRGTVPGNTPAPGNPSNPGGGGNSGGGSGNSGVGVGNGGGNGTGNEGNGVGPGNGNSAGSGNSGVGVGNGGGNGTGNEGNGVGPGNGNGGGNGNGRG